jgi:hypothetical protein
LKNGNERNKEREHMMMYWLGIMKNEKKSVHE